jgi:hypothetical protein
MPTARPHWPLSRWASGPLEHLGSRAAAVFERGAHMLCVEVEAVASLGAEQDVPKIEAMLQRWAISDKRAEFPLCTPSLSLCCQHW